MELTDINLRQVALIIKAHGEKYADSSWQSNAPVEHQSRLMFIQGGRLDYRIDGKKYQVKKNQLILIPENRHVKYRVPKDELVHLRYCNFNAAFGKKSIFDYLEGDWVVDVNNADELIAMFKRLDYVDDSNIIRDFINKKRCLVSILDIFLEKSNLKVIDEKEEDKIDLSGLVDFIKRNINLNDIVNLDYLAKLAHVHPNHLIREFKKKYGKSPMQFVLEERTEEAKRMLINTNLSINDISQYLNFKNPKYFSKFFKRRTGITPSQFRKQEKQSK